MFNVIIALTTGVLVGVVFHKKDSVIKASEQVITYTICLLLFLLGMSVGANKLIVANIGLLGVQALFLAVCAITGSILFCCLFYKLFFNHEI